MTSDGVLTELDGVLTELDGVLTELNFLTAIGGRTNPNRVYELKSDS